MTRTESRTGSANPTSVHPVLLELLEKDELDWDDHQQREMYLRAWVAGNVPRFSPPEGGAC